MSWIHRTDLIGLIEWSLTNERLAGPVNAVAPEVVRMKDFCGTLGKILGRPSWLPVPAFALRAAFGELASIMTTGQRVVPKVALESGYRFRFPQLEPALQSILGRRQIQRSSVRADRIRLGISRCLLGDEVRYDGDTSETAF